MPHEVTLRIVLEKPTPGVAYGLQEGKGADFKTLQRQTSNSSDLTFEFTVPVKFDRNNNPIFVGPYSQGSPTDRFIYIDIGTYAGQANTPWSRRLKIPLNTITRTMIEHLSRTDVLMAKLPGSGRDGGPTCGTIKPFDGWKVVSATTSKRK